jgi:hypothetical protein
MPPWCSGGFLDDKSSPQRRFRDQQFWIAVKVHKTTLSLKIFFHDAFSKRGFIVHCVD